MIQRQRIEAFETDFEKLHLRALELLDSFPEDRLFEPSGLISFGFEIIRSAAEVEKTFGGITTRLWDDPFEWTLPEQLSEKSSIKNYLEEVRSTRTNGLRFIKHDGELSLQIPAPEMVLSLSEILNATVTISTFHLERAFSINKATTGTLCPL